MRATPGPHDNGLAVRTEGDVLGFSVEKHVLHQVTTLKFLKRGVWGKFCAVCFAVDLNVCFFKMLSYRFDRFIKSHLMFTRLCISSVLF